MSSDSEKRKKILKYGLQGKPVVQITTVVILVVMMVVLGVIVKLLKEKGIVEWKDVLGPTIAVMVAVITYQQWRANKHETSIDKYYDRLEVANRRMEALEGVSKLDLYVFAELDKLEYVIIKYRVGYVSPRLTLRAIHNFEGICQARPDVREKSLFWVQKAAYLDETRDVVKAAATGITHETKT